MSLKAISQTPLLTLLTPRDRLPLVLIFSAAALLIWAFLLGQDRLSLSSSSLVALGIISIPIAVKLFDDAKHWGLAATVLTSLVLLQGLHTLEHLAQVFQYFVLGWSSSQALGLITQANLEWIHFSWNLLVLAGILLVFIKGLRNPWAYLLLIWAGLHSLEHSYLLVRHLQVSAELTRLGLPIFEASQSLPGILGKDGFLALSSWCGNIPGLTTGSRAVVHFWWNFGEISLLLLAAHKGANQLFVHHHKAKHLVEKRRKHEAA